jgi:hypothetical protein
MESTLLGLVLDSSIIIEAERKGQTVEQLLELELSSFLTQPVKTQNPSPSLSTMTESAGGDSLCARDGLAIPGKEEQARTGSSSALMVGFSRVTSYSGLGYWLLISHCLRLPAGCRWSRPKISEPPRYTRTKRKAPCNPPSWHNKK